MSKIAILIPTLDRVGGAEQQVLLLAAGLRRRGWAVFVIALSGSGGEAAEKLRADGIGFHSLEMRKGLADPRGWIRLRSWLRREKPDVVHAHLPHAAWMARWSRLGTPVRVLVDTIHTTATGTWGRGFGYRVSNWLTDGTTAVSGAVAEAWSKVGLVAAEKVTVLPNGVDVEAWKPDEEVRERVRAKLGEEFLWFAAGRLEPVKDYFTTLEAFTRLPAKSRLVIAGWGPLESELKELAQALGVAERVRFLGFEPDVRRWMQSADGFVLSSRWEGLPMGILEAAACGLPAVATDVAGTREAVVDGETGLLAEAANPQALADRMSALMKRTAAERRAMGEKARERVVAQFSLAAVLDMWDALYGELLERNPAPKRWG